MSNTQSDPPKQAIWLLQNLCPGDSEALTGDLIERFHEGQTNTWFWKQVLTACAIGLSTRYWPHFLYAITGIVMPALLRTEVSSYVYWSPLPWPLSQILFDLRGATLPALEALPVLAVGLLIQRSFRWISLLRTGMINLVLLAMSNFLFDALLNAFMPWLTRPIPSDPYHRTLIIPGIMRMLWAFSIFLISAWLGCGRKSKEHARSSH